MKKAPSHGARKKGGIGKMLLANGGTLFLDEIGDMPLHLQGRLLRALQERAVSPLGSSKVIHIDVSVVCATNRNLRDLVANGQFREDLYYRLNGLVVRLPACASAATSTWWPPGCCARTRRACNPASRPASASR